MSERQSSALETSYQHIERYLRSNFLQKMVSFLSFLTGMTAKSQSMIIRILVFHERLVILPRYATNRGRGVSWGHYVEFLGKTINPRSASLHQEV